MSIVFLVTPCFSHADCVVFLLLFVLSFIVYVASYVHVDFVSHSLWYCL